MGRRPLVSLQPDQAHSFRRLVRQKLGAKHLPQRVLVNPSGVEERSERWIQNALSQGRRLPLKTAEDVISRLALAGVASWKELSQFDKLLPKYDSELSRPILLVFPGQSAPLARDLAAEAIRVNGIGLSKEARLAEKFTKYLQSYENVFETPGFRDRVLWMFKVMRQRYGEEWWVIFSGQNELATRAWLRLNKKVRDLKRSGLLTRATLEAEVVELLHARQSGSELSRKKLNRRRKS